jgi:hypothetical protein
MWAMDNRNTFGHVWFMEDDVHYTDMDSLLGIMNSQEVDVDLVYQNDPGILKESAWRYYRNKTRAELMSFFTEEQLGIHHQNVMLNFFRLSRTYLDKLEEVYDGMGQQWAFFEALFPTVASFYDLKRMQWTPAEKQHSMEFRPCYTNFTVPGLYHPVKFRDGKPFPCHCFEWYSEVCSPRYNGTSYNPRAWQQCLECPAARKANFTLTKSERSFLWRVKHLANGDKTILEELGFTLDLLEDIYYQALTYFNTHVLHTILQDTSNAKKGTYNKK